ncbi:MAG: gluconeogenesis factor YvcK family protein [Candidatus Omnitrophota bacterium]
MGKKIKFKKKLSQFFKPFKWLYPGMGVKRWLSLSFVGIIFIVAGGQFLSGPTSLFRAVGITYMFIGMVIIFLGVKRVIFIFLGVVSPQRQEELVDLLYQKKHLERGLRIAAIGGGTGLSVLLQGLKQYTSNLTAIVTVADDGGSSGKLREDFNILPPGDIRNCLVALADTSPLMEELFQYRFEGESTLGGHSFGNIFLLALSRVTKDFGEAVQAASKILAIRGRVLPSTLSKVRLIAELKDGTSTSGESNITRRKNKSPIKRLYLDPADCQPTESSLEAIANADAIVLGPGSLYTSIMPNLLIGPIAAAVNNSTAIKLYVCNVMTQPGETTNFKSSDHVKVLLHNTRLKKIDYAIINNSNIPKAVEQRYRSENACRVEADLDNIRGLGVMPIEDSFMTVSGMRDMEYLRHNPRRLAKSIIDIISIAKSEAAHR